jgi:hypothetical protein
MMLTELRFAVKFVRFGAERLHVFLVTSPRSYVLFLGLEILPLAQLALPQMQAIPVVASAVGDQKTAGFPIAALANVAPPLTDVVYGKRRDRRR